jgi:hypothetical protein
VPFVTVKIVAPRSATTRGWAGAAAWPATRVPVAGASTRSAPTPAKIGRRNEKCWRITKTSTFENDRDA